MRVRETVPVPGDGPRPGPPEAHGEDGQADSGEHAVRDPPGRREVELREEEDEADREDDAGSADDVGEG
jgi:hypothetical protein